MSRIGYVRLAAAIVASAPWAMAAVPARAQGAPPAAGSGQIARDQPVYYQADTAEYDRDSGIVTLQGNVQIWQDDKVLRADRVTLDRNTNVAAAEGHVTIVQPDGQVMFSDYAELSQGMTDGVLRDMSMRLPQNGRLVANGARRTGGQINELSRPVYTTCDLCAAHPDNAPLWEIRARSAVQDIANKRIEYRDAVIDLYGVPVAWFPYLTHPDPSEKRASGVLIPSIGVSKNLGPFVEVPYFWAIDRSSDATITPILAADKGPAVDVQYRQRFNDGTLNINASGAYDLGGAQGHLFAKGQFAIDETWRWGFDINRASSATYMRDFRISGLNDLLTSQVYLEGFGQGAYSRVDVRAYQGLSSSIVASKLPYVLPRYEYSFFGEPDALGGRLSVDAGAFNVVRDDGTKTQRVSLSANWDKRFTGLVGDVWKATLHVDSAGYNAQSLNKQPNYGTISDASTAQAMPTAAMEVHWPLQRDAGSWGSQVVEPILQVVAAPNTMNYVNSHVPNEDALDTDFTDANLFALNRHSGIDRLEGGMRANVALHAAWTFPAGSTVDGLIGQSYRTRADSSFLNGTGLNKATSDVVSHLSFTPNQYVDLTTRQRFDRRNFNVTFADAVLSGGPSWLRMSAGYLYSNTNPYFYYDTPPTTNTLPGPPRNEVSLGMNTHYGRWRFDASGRQDVRTGKPVGVSVGTAYEDECFVFDVRFYRRYTSIANDHGDTAVLFQITLKTVGEFGFHAM